MRIPLVLAANLETLIGVAFVVISLISGLMNYLNSRAKPNGPNNRAGRPVRPRSERIQSEIEQFMREQVRKQEGDAPAGRPAATGAQNRAEAGPAGQAVAPAPAASSARACTGPPPASRPCRSKGNRSTSRPSSPQRCGLAKNSAIANRSRPKDSDRDFAST